MLSTLDIPDLVADDDGDEARARNSRVIGERFDDYADPRFRVAKVLRLGIPGRKIYLAEAPILDERHAGLTLDLNGSSLVNLRAGNYPYSTSLFVYGRNMGYADAISYARGPSAFLLTDQKQAGNYKVGDAVFLFQGWYQDGGRSPRQQTVTITAVEGDSVVVDQNLLEGMTHARWLRNGRVVSSLNDIDGIKFAGREEDSRSYKEGDRVWTGDGVYVNEAFGEYATVLESAYEAGTVTVRFCRPPARQYLPFRQVVVPGPWAEGITVRNGELGCSANEVEDVSFGAKFAPGLRLEGLKFGRPDARLCPHAACLTTCDWVVVVDCDFTYGVQVGDCHYVDFVRCVVRGAAHEEDTSEIFYRGCGLSGGVWHSAGACRLNFLSCSFRGRGAWIFPKGCKLVGCRGDQLPVELLLQGGGHVVRDFHTDSWIRVQAGGNNLVENVTAGAVLLDQDTGGVAGQVTAEFLQYTDGDPWVFRPPITARVNVGRRPPLSTTLPV